MESPSPTNQPTGPPVLQTILRRPFQGLEPFAEWLKENTSNYIIGEHEADLEIQTTHCHILIEGLKVTRESLRKQIVKYSPGQGQNCTMARTEKTKVLYQTDPLMDYILKGEISHYRASSFTPQKINESVSRWVKHDKKQDNAQAPGLMTITAPKKKPPTKFEDCHQILDKYFTRTIENPDAALDVKTIQGRSRIERVIIAWANENRRAMNPYLVADYYDEIIKQGLPDHYQNMCSAIINHRHRHFSHS